MTYISSYLILAIGIWHNNLTIENEGHDRGVVATNHKYTAFLYNMLTTLNSLEDSYRVTGLHYHSPSPRYQYGQAAPVTYKLVIVKFVFIIDLLWGSYTKHTALNRKRHNYASTTGWQYLPYRIVPMKLSRTWKKSNKHKQYLVRTRMKCRIELWEYMCVTMSLTLFDLQVYIEGKKYIQTVKTNKRCCRVTLERNRIFCKTH